MMNFVMPAVFARTRGHGDPSKPSKVLNGDQPSPKDAAFGRNIDIDVNVLSKCPFGSRGGILRKATSKSRKTVAEVVRAPLDMTFSELSASRIFTPEFHPCHRNTNHPNWGCPHPVVLGSQTATSGTSGTTYLTVAEDWRLWQRQPIAVSFVTRMISGEDVSNCQATNLHAFET
jgi:hypothetical protein